jgi:hypothetical protein
MHLWFLASEMRTGLFSLLPLASSTSIARKSTANLDIDPSPAPRPTAPTGPGSIDFWRDRRLALNARAESNLGLFTRPAPKRRRPRRRERGARMRR